MKPYVTLFMLSSVDGKISTGSGDTLDFDKDLPNIGGDVSKGLYQYYDIEQTTDLWSLNSGRVMNKMGVNRKPFFKRKNVGIIRHSRQQSFVKTWCAVFMCYG